VLAFPLALVLGFAASDRIWQHLGSSGGIPEHLAASDNAWKHLAAPELAASGSIWEHLTGLMKGWELVF